MMEQGADHLRSATETLTVGNRRNNRNIHTKDITGTQTKKINTQKELMRQETKYRQKRFGPSFNIQTSSGRRNQI